ncbi:type II toxin-antitoxin system HicA family toxin [Gloeocapsa sp. PCC 73106]|uniref:type II toxin-antitoxin system HicA family toxin n=1 Tax=Gloeocapsa sp. PCC 73106 TaxID=102232 RepID=UPI0002ACD907|nr:type II toxin-antitoxin system HicA family toxin [Gloeocapsa sp. PCC 73106]ELR99392.1 hypothetical protein GLO73106DRAFT_00032430 [Gloeocapsa sp. PCC 73106]
MGKYEKLLQTILTGTSDNNISFSELCQLLNKLSFDERVRGDHYIFTKDRVEEIINIQPKNSKAKGYQVKQIRNIIVKYGLGDSDVG